MLLNPRFHPYSTEPPQCRRIVSLERGRHPEGHSQRLGRSFWSVLILSHTTRVLNVYHRRICRSPPVFSPPRQERPCPCYARCHLLCCWSLLRKNAVQSTRLKCIHILISQAILLIIGYPCEVADKVVAPDLRPTLTLPRSSLQWWEWRFGYERPST